MKQEVLLIQARTDNALKAGFLVNSFPRTELRSEANFEHSMCSFSKSKMAGPAALQKTGTKG